MAGVKRKAKPEPAAESETVSLLVLIEVLQNIMHCNMYLNENRKKKLEFFSYALSDVESYMPTTEVHLTWAATPVYLEPCITQHFLPPKAAQK